MKILIIEDEPRTANLLKEFIDLYDPSIEILKILDSVDESAKYLANCTSQPDLIFMDIQLSDGLSFEIFNKLQITSPVIFCTAYEEFTLQAFKSNGVDYILKPFKESDVATALDKIERLKRAFALTGKIPVPVSNHQLPGKSLSHFLVSYRGKMYPINIKNTAAFYMDDERIYLITFNGDKYLLNRKMEEVQNSIDSSAFFRISRQMIINRNAIDNIEQYFNRKLFVKLKVSPPIKPIVSRLKVGPFMHWLETT